MQVEKRRWYGLAIPPRPRNKKVWRLAYNAGKEKQRGVGTRTKVEGEKQRLKEEGNLRSRAFNKRDLQEGGGYLLGRRRDRRQRELILGSTSS